jgi:hypothetical protein
VCGLVIGEAGIGVPHDQPCYICEADNPLLVDKMYVLILHKYFDVSCSVFCF